MNDAKVMPVDYDDILLDIGEFGLWQKCLFGLMWFPAALSAMPVFLHEFITFVPDHRCRIPTCDDMQEDTKFKESFVSLAIPADKTTNISKSCFMFTDAGTFCMSEEEDLSTHRNDEIECTDGWVFDRSMFEDTAAMGFQMVCEGAWKKSFSQSFFMLGMLIGSFLFGYLADKFGRKPTLVIAAGILGLSGLLCTAIPAHPSMYILFVIGRFVSGIGQVGTFMMAFTLTLEYTSPRYRVFCGCLIETPFSLGGIIVGALSWAGIRKWTNLQIICTLPSLLLLISYYWIIPESPRWLLAKGEIERLKIDIKKTASMNKKPCPSYILDSESKLEPEEEEQHREEPKLTDLFWPFSLCIRSLVIFYVWIVVTLCYYALTMTASTLSEDFFLNYTLLLIADFPAHIFCLVLVDVWGRKKILTLSLVMSGVTCIAAGLLSGFPWTQVALSMIGKFGATACFTIIFLYTAELYPTMIRSTAVGTGSMCGRIGGFLAPQVSFLASLWGPLPLLTMGFLTLLGGILTILTTPETLGKKLPETKQEAINLSQITDDASSLNENVEKEERLLPQVKA